ncbi:hypothetical protein Y032_0003g1271 [Ancylostoma ceylanicum]|nr:hypothetical protein Y032_0003g1271 [Ancylostoma ceylanicum]
MVPGRTVSRPADVFSVSGTVDERTVYSKLQTAVDKGRNRGAAFLGGETGVQHAGSGCLLLPARVSSCSRQPELARRAPVSLPKNASPGSRLLSRAVWSSLQSNAVSLELSRVGGTIAALIG